MAKVARLFRVDRPLLPPVRWADGIILLALATLVSGALYLALDVPREIRGPDISLSPSALPWYAARSLGRMTASYALSLAFCLPYGYAAARSRRTERVLLPLLDVLESVPILSFLPVVLLALSAFLPKGFAAEAASVILIFTSQAWNIAFGWYQSLTTVPRDLRNASETFRFSPWLRLKTVELPFAASGLIWNSVMSWANGWFFLMAAETFTVGRRDFRLPGLGSYLAEAASRGDIRAVWWGVLVLVVMIVALDQLLWRPLIAWSDRFRVDLSENDNPPRSWFYDAIRSSALHAFLSEKIVSRLSERVDDWLRHRFPPREAAEPERQARPWVTYAVVVGVAALLLDGGVRSVRMLLQVSPSQWVDIAAGLGATFLRVFASLAIALSWTIPVGVLIGTIPRLARWLQPLVQLIASVPATALFPVLLLLLLDLPWGLNLAAVTLMLLGAQWYVLFNVIAGASAIPQDLKQTAVLLRLTPWQRWRTLVLPALFPYVVTGAITAGGGAWNASIVAEHLEFGGRTLHTTGIGAIIAQSGARGDFSLLLAATLVMVVTVVVFNRLVWRRLYDLAEDKYRME